MNVLSLFDGISCGRVALDRAKIKVDSYYASEIDNNAIKVATHNYPSTIEIGDVRYVHYEKGILYTKNGEFKIGKIDLLIGGSPCTNLSFSGKREGMITKTKEKIFTLDRYLKLKEEGFEFEGYSYLFWEYMRILEEIREENKDVLFLLENVVMSNEWEDTFTKAIGLPPVKINSSLVSAQNRVRLYWTNINKGNIPQPEDKNIKLKDILEDVTFIGPAAIRGRELNKATIIGRRLDENGHRKDMNRKYPIVQCLEVRSTNKDKSNCLTTVDKDNVLTPLPEGRHPDAFGKISGKRLEFRNYTRTEYERLQTLPDGYTNVVSEHAAKKAIGNGWTVNVIAHIFSQIKQ